MGGWTSAGAGLSAINNMTQTPTATIASGVGGGVGALLGYMGGNPLLSMILSQVGATALEKILGGGTSPYEKLQKQQMNALKQQLPIIQAQARGKPSPATQNQLAQLRQATTRAQQSYGSTALGRNVGQTTTTKASQQRFRTAETQAMGNILGNAQLAAQQQLVGLGTAGATAMRDIEIREQQNRNQMYNDIGRMMNVYRQRQQANALTPEMQETMAMVRDVFRMVQSALRQ